MRSTSTPCLDRLEAVYEVLTRKVDTPVSLGMWLRFKYQEFSQLVTKDINPLDYISAAAFQKDYAVVKYLSKYATLPTGIDLDAVALASWKEAESQCLETNRRLRSSLDPQGHIAAVLSTAQWKIANCLKSFSWLKATDGCKWGPGATLALKGESATVADKIGLMPIDVTRKALPVLKLVIEADPHWAETFLGSIPSAPFSLISAACFKVVDGCRATLVPKTAKTKRSIAIEPTGNIFLQLGMGRFLRSCLRRVGVDLDDQMHNRRLAKLGSRFGSLATLDLKAASDTVCTEVVFQLLPYDVASYLDLLRSPSLTWDGATWVKLEKFSSMGNGFTFELESLLFWALTSATADVLGVRAPIGVYGDDIVCSTEVAPLLKEVLAYCGFTVNSEKSHERGYFRESCGGHYWNGLDVTPPYQKETLDSLPELYRCANRLRRAYLRGVDDYRTSEVRWFELTWRVVIRLVGESLGCRYQRLPSISQILTDLATKKVHVIPERDDSDDGLLLPQGELNRFALDYDVHGWIKLPVLSFRPHKKAVCNRALLAYTLRYWPESPFEGRVALRRRGRWVSRRRWFVLWILDARHAERMN